MIYLIQWAVKDGAILEQVSRKQWLETAAHSVAEIEVARVNHHDALLLRNDLLELFK